MEFDTIVSLASAPGEGAIGIIRISGSKALNILKAVFKTKKGKNINQFINRKMIYGEIIGSNNETLDEVMAVFMKGPKTYTCEDVVEIYCHGGVLPLQNVLQEILRQDVRMAEPGEFTKRAFLNGRLDLSQAESVMDVISAKTKQGFDVAFSQLEGVLSLKIKNLRKKLIDLLAHLAVSIDYPEEDIEEITYNEVFKILGECNKEIEFLLSSSEAGRIIREGLYTAIVGKPNVGKSSLLNALSRQTRAIVTDVPGTTRDVIETFVNVKGIPLRLIDTAGIRETEDIVEKIGVERSKDVFNSADLVIFVINGAEPLTMEDEEIIQKLEGKKALIVINKVDLPPAFESKYLEERLPGRPFIKMSVIDETGLDLLEKAILKMVYGTEIRQKESAYVSNSRHIQALEHAKAAIKKAVSSTENGLPYDFIEVDIRDAHEYLGKITGETVEEDLLTQIFGQFCLGK